MRKKIFLLSLLSLSDRIDGGVDELYGCNICIDSIIWSAIVGDLEEYELDVPRWVFTTFNLLGHSVHLDIRLP